MSHKVFPFLLALVCFLWPNATQAKNIIYIPLDDRPMSLKYTIESVTLYGYNVITPPVRLLSSRDRAGNPDKLWNWLLDNADSANIMIIAADSLVYGGLVPSRLHNLQESTLKERIERFKDLKNKFPKTKIYCFSSLLRTPRESHGGVEPHYYEKYGDFLFRIGELTDKNEMYGKDILDQTEIKNLKELTPPEYYKDWFERRQKNLTAHYQFAQLVREKIFYYYVVGKDDNAPFSQTHLETRLLTSKTKNISPALFQIIPGIDQIGLLLLTRAINDDEWKQPYIYTVYADGLGPLTVPLYSDQPVNESVNIQIMAAGAFPTSEPDKADLFLVVNTPSDGVNKESNHPENLFFASQNNRILVDEIETLHKAGKPIALADVAYANGADNGFMAELCRQELTYSLKAYSGWNTADNSIGYAIAQGLLARKYSREAIHDTLSMRFLDDWYYQANVRPMLTEVAQRENINIYYLERESDWMRSHLLQRMRVFNKKYNSLISDKFVAKFPWNRLFEVNVELIK